MKGQLGLLAVQNPGSTGVRKRFGNVKVGRRIMPGVGVAVRKGVRHLNVALIVMSRVISKLSFSSEDVIEPDHPEKPQPLAGWAAIVTFVPSLYLRSRPACGEIMILPTVGSTGPSFNVRLGAGVGVSVAVADGVGIAVGDAVGVAGGVGVTVDDGVGVWVAGTAVAVTVAVAVAVAVGSGITAATGWNDTLNVVSVSLSVLFWSDTVSAFET